MSKIHLYLTCEHAKNSIPSAYRALFSKHQNLLYTHRGWDIGALKITQILSRKLRAPYCKGKYSRLLIDLNRCPTNKNLYSFLTKPLPKEERMRIFHSYYLPYRTQVEKDLASLVKKPGKVLNLSIHSFTPSLNGQMRNADIGLLYDPQCAPEKNFCVAWKASLESATDLRVRLNYPYRGTSDGFINTMRRKFPNRNKFWGLCIEVNQALLTSRSGTQEVGQMLAKTLVDAMKI